MNCCIRKEGRGPSGGAKSRRPHQRTNQQQESRNAGPTSSTPGAKVLAVEVFGGRFWIAPTSTLTREPPSATVRGSKRFLATAARTWAQSAAGGCPPRERCDPSHPQRRYLSRVQPIPAVRGQSANVNSSSTYTNSG